MQKSKIAVVGLWHQGIVAAACLAEKGYKVIGIDSSEETISLLRKGQSPIFEPGLDSLINNGIKKKLLCFSNDYSNVVGSKVIHLAHDTPVDSADNVNIASVIDDVKSLMPYIKNQIIHITAQLPAGTSNLIKTMIKKKVIDFYKIAYTPENLRLGQAIDRFNNPPLPVIGTDDDQVFNSLSKIYYPFCKNWERTDLLSAEFVKHALNTFLATSITLANEIGNITDSMGANGHEVGRLLKLEPRIGNGALLRPGMGFSGGTLARDVKALLNFSKQNNLKSSLLNGVWASNKNQNILPISIIENIFERKIKGKKILVLGLTYKPDTSTLRRSLSIEIIKKLINVGFEITSYDPKANREELKKYNNIGFSESITKAASGVDLILSITPWKDFLMLDFKELRKIVKKNLFFDISGLFNKEYIENYGFKYISIGNGSTYKEEEK